MESLRLSGLATGLDTSSLIKQLMQVERRPINMMQTAQKLAQSRIDMYRNINTKLVALQRAAEKVKGMAFDPTSGTGPMVASASVVNGAILNAVAASTAAAGTYNFNVLSLSRAQITGGGGFSIPAGTRTVTNSDPTRFTATTSASTPTGTYNINVQSLAQTQLNSGGAFTVPGSTVTVGAPGNYSATATATATAGSYSVDILKLAETQISGGGVFASPTVTATPGDPAVISATVTGTPTTQNPTVTVNRLVQNQVYTSGAYNQNPGNGRTLTITNTTAGTPATTITFTNAQGNINAVRDHINASTAASGVTASVVSGRLVLTGSNGDAYSFGGTAATRIGVAAGSVTTFAQKAQITVGTTTITNTGNNNNTFINPITGLTITALAVGTTNLNVQNQAGSIRISNVAAGTSTDVAIAVGDDITTVMNKINAANTGMTASINAGRLELTGAVAGQQFTIADAPGTTGLATRLGLTPLIRDPRASLSVDGGATVYSNSNTFTNPIPGVTLTATGTGVAGMTISDGGGMLRIRDDAAGTFTDIAIAEGADITSVMNTINAANSGMTASINAGRLELTGNTVGKTFTVEDAAGGSALATALGVATISRTASLASLSINGGASITSTTNSFANPGALTGTTINALATGTSTLKVADLAGTLRIIDDSTGLFKDIEVQAGWNISQVRNAINASGSGMTATTDGTTLTLTGNTAGKSFTIEDANGGNTLAAALGIDSLSRTTQIASQAQLTVDGGGVITSTSNTFVDPVTGLTITAKAIGATAVNVTQTASGPAASDPTTEAVRDLVNKFNDVVGYIKENTGYNPNTKKSGALISDTTVIKLRQNLSRMFTGDVNVDDPTALQNGQSVGLLLQRDGTMAFDADKFAAAMTANATAVKNLFSAEDGLMVADGNGSQMKTNAIATTGVVGDGIANRLANFVDSMIASSSQYNGTDAVTGTRLAGALLGAIQKNELTISNLNKRIEEYEIRLADKERLLQTKFAAMERTVAMLRNQGNYLSSQFMGMNRG